MRKLTFPAIKLIAVFAVITGLLYPLVIWVVGQATMSYRANGSFITRKGQVVGSALIGQSFSDKDGNPLPQYFQPRPSAAGAGYDPTASSASNLGPGDPRLVGFIPGFNSVGLDGNASAKNPFASADDPYCVPTDPTGAPVTAPAAGQKYAKNKDGSYVCDPATVPERAIAYRQLNGLAPGTTLPVDAVTASASGLDPDISVLNADMQAARVAHARHLSVEQVLNVVKAHTLSRQWGVLGEVTVRVLDLNLALDAIR